MKLRGVRWYIAALLFTASVINYVDRQTLSVLAPALTKQLHMSAMGYADVLQAFLIAYTVMYLGSGFIVDKLGARVSLACFMAFWSVANMLHAFARNAFQLGLFRCLLGMGEPGNFMAAFKTISEWYPPKEKGFVNGLVNGGATVGAIIAAPLVVWLSFRFNWRFAFVATGALGFVWLAAWLALYRAPEKHPLITPSEAALVQAGKAAGPRTKSPIKKSELLRLPQTWGLLIAKFLSDPVWWFYLFWLPKYLVDQRGFTMAQIGIISWLPYLSADLGAFTGGIASGWLVKRGFAPLRARRVSLIPCALLMPLSVFIPFVPIVSALVIISIVTFAHMAWKTNLMTMTNDAYPIGVVGSVSGIIAFGSGLGSTLFTNLTGQIVQHSSYTAVFVIMGFLHPAAYFAVRAFVKKPVESLSEVNHYAQA
jgi:ACS family hexuronate transporter-like MFS transporter